MQVSKTNVTKLIIITNF